MSVQIRHLLLRNTASSGLFRLSLPSIADHASLIGLKCCKDIHLPTASSLGREAAGGAPDEASGIDIRAILAFKFEGYP